MFKVILTAPTLCLYDMNKEYKDTYDFKTKPSPRQVELLQRKFALVNNTELDSITIDIIESKEC
jgi:hypothetical protein